MDEQEFSEELIERLVRVDEQIARSADKPLSFAGAAAAPTASPADTAGDSQLAEAARCLELLERVRRRGPEWDDTPTSALTTDIALTFDTGSETLRTIGRFEIRERLGSGGFGVVFRAWDPQLDRVVALKIPRFEGLIDEQFQQRFVREAKAAASMSHALIAPIFDAGRIGPIHYIASAYCSGGSIDELVRDQGGQLPPQTAAAIIAGLAQAVQHAHGRGIIHRDIKPQNVLLAGEQEKAPADAEALTLAEQVRLVDFGLARWTGTRDSTTRSGAVVGTPAFMAPEQARGDAARISPAVDIYALGATLYYILTGRPPFVAPAEADVLHAVLTTDPSPPSRFASAVPRDLDAICRKCLEKEPARRYAFASALEFDLRRFLAHLPIEARPIRAPERLVRWVSRNPALAAVAGLLILALVSGSTISTYYWWQSERALSEATIQKTRADDRAAEALVQAQQARIAVDELLAGIAREPRLQSEGLEEFRKQLLETATGYYQRLRTETPQDAAVRREHVASLHGLAVMHRLLGNPQQAVEIWENAAGVVQAADDVDQLAVANIWAQQADDLLLLRRFDEAIERVSQAVNLVRGRAEIDSSEKTRRGLIATLVQAAQTVNHNGQPGRANTVIDQAIELACELSATPSAEWPGEEDFGRVCRSKVEIASRMADHDAVEQFARTGLRIYAQVEADQPHRRSACRDSRATLHRSLGDSLSVRGRYEDASREFESEREQIEVLIESHPDVPLLAVKMASNGYRRARTLKAAGHSDQAVNLSHAELDWIRQWVEQHPQMALMLMSTQIHHLQLLAIAAQDRAEDDEARRHLAQALEFAEQLCSVDQPARNDRMLYGNLHNQLAALQLRAGRPKDAYASFRQAEALLREVVEHAPGDAESQSILSSILRNQVLLEIRQRDFERVLEHCEELASREQSARDALIVRGRKIVALALSSRAAEAWPLFQQEVQQAEGVGSLFFLSKCASQIAGDDETQDTDAEQFLRAAREIYARPEVRKLIKDTPQAAADFATSPEFKALRHSLAPEQQQTGLGPKPGHFSAQPQLFRGLPRSESPTARPGLHA